VSPTAERHIDEPSPRRPCWNAKNGSPEGRDPGAWTAIRRRLAGGARQQQCPTGGKAAAARRRCRFCFGNAQPLGRPELADENCSHQSGLLSQDRLCPLPVSPAVAREKAAGAHQECRFRIEPHPLFSLLSAGNLQRARARRRGDGSAVAIENASQRLEFVAQRSDIVNILNTYLAITASLDDLVSAGEEHRRERQAERLRGLQIDDQLEFGRPLDRQICRLGAFEDLVDIGRDALLRVVQIGSVAHQTANHNELAERVDCRQLAARREFNDPAHFGNENGIARVDQGFGVLAVIAAKACARLATNHKATGSPTNIMTIGIVEVAALAASIAGAVTATMTSGASRTNSAARAGRRSKCPSA
jgi:hypothetical protein